MTSLSPIAAVGTSFFNKFFAVEMQTTCPSISGSGIELYVVDEIRRRHSGLLKVSATCALHIILYAQLFLKIKL